MRKLALAFVLLGACAQAGTGSYYGVELEGAGGTTGSTGKSNSNSAGEQTSAPAAEGASTGNVYNASASGANASSATSGATSSGASTNAASSTTGVSASTAASVAASTVSAASSTSSTVAASSSSTGGGTCDPMKPAIVCGSGKHCLPTTNGVPQCKGPTGAGTQYSTCKTSDTCAPAFECVTTPYKTTYCLQWCKSDVDCLSPNKCNALNPKVFVGATQYGVCYDGLP
jgi:hypothetical protein